MDLVASTIAIAIKLVLLTTRRKKGQAKSGTYNKIILMW